MELAADGKSRQGPRNSQLQVSGLVSGWREPDTGNWMPGFLGNESGPWARGRGVERESEEGGDAEVFPSPSPLSTRVPPCKRQAI